MKTLPPLLLLTLLLISCNSDRKKETISNYIRYIWKINADKRYDLLALEEKKAITAQDSLEILIKKFTEGEKEQPSADSLIADYKKDELYNSNLLTKTKVKIDSFKKYNPGDNAFFTEYIKSLEQLRDFTASQIEEIKAERYLLEKYKSDPDQVLCHQVLCRYRIRKELPDTTSKIYTQIFYLSNDTKRVLAVNQ